MTIHLNNNSENGWYVTAEPFCEWEDDMNTLPCLEPEVIIPAWSLHRLAEMLASQWGEVMLFLPDAYDDIISDIEIEIGRGNFNKKFLV